MRSHLKAPFTKGYLNKIIGYCYHSVNVNYHFQSGQNDYIKQHLRTLSQIDLTKAFSKILRSVMTENEMLPCFVSEWRKYSQTFGIVTFHFRFWKTHFRSTKLDDLTNGILVTDVGLDNRKWIKSEKQATQSDRFIPWYDTQFQVSKKMVFLIGVVICQILATLYFRSSE